MNFTKIINSIFSTTPVMIILSLFVDNGWIYGATIDLPPIQRHPKKFSVSAPELTRVPRGRLVRAQPFQQSEITEQTYASIKGLGHNKCTKIIGIIGYLKLFRGITSEYERASIVASVASIPDEHYLTVEALIEMHHLLRGVTSGYVISSIIRAVSAVANSDILQPVPDKQGRAAVIEAVIKAPDLQRATILALTQKHQLFKYITNGFERAAVIQAIGFIPPELYDRVLHSIPITFSGIDLSKRIILRTSQVRG